MRDPECVEFLRWALPRLGLRWEGFRRVRGQVCKRLARRVAVLGLDGLGAYRRHVEAHAEEAALLDGLCRISISRFYRDRAVFDAVGQRVLPALAVAAETRGENHLRVWSAGCAGGEEPYTLALIWRFVLAARFPDLTIRIHATDSDPVALERARRGCYKASSLKELPPAWRDGAFARDEGLFRLRDELRSVVDFRCEDIRERMPDGPFHLVFWRNVAFTYFAEPVQRRLASLLIDRLVPGGVLVVGSHERLPQPAAPLVADPEVPAVHWQMTLAT